MNLPNKHKYVEELTPSENIYHWPVNLCCGCDDVIISKNIATIEAYGLVSNIIWSVKWTTNIFTASQMDFRYAA